MKNYPNFFILQSFKFSLCNLFTFLSLFSLFLIQPRTLHLTTPPSQPSSIHWKPLGHTIKSSELFLLPLSLSQLLLSIMHPARTPSVFGPLVFLDINLHQLSSQSKFDERQSWLSFVFAVMFFMPSRLFFLVFFPVQSSLLDVHLFESHSCLCSISMPFKSFKKSSLTLPLHCF